MNIVELFWQHFPHATPPLVCSAPGRINLMGEHTDYNHGYVLPMAIEFRTQVALSLRRDQTVHVYSKNLAKHAKFHLTEKLDTAKRQWYFYIAGVFQLLTQQKHAKYGADIVVDSDIPMGAGLSSSASLEVATGFAFLNAHHHAINLIDLALICQQAEHYYVGTHCGIMDQLICGLGQKHHALLIDCENLQLEPIPLPMHNVSWLICNTAIRHELASSAYNTRRHECEIGAAAMQVNNLRQANLAMLEDHKTKLSPTLYQRCHHVITENTRTINASIAMKSQNWETLGKLMVESHSSLQENYHVSCTELDFLVDCALTIPGTYGARMTGGGFGGCTVNLVQDAYIPTFAEQIITAYQSKFGYPPEIYRSKPQNGVRVIESDSEIYSME